MKVWRHGDVVIQQIDSIPANIPTAEGYKALPKLEFHSETGKLHTLQLTGSSQGYQEESQDQESYFTLSEPTPITHEEHAPITLPSGTFRAFRIRDYNRMRGD